MLQAIDAAKKTLAQAEWFSELEKLVEESLKLSGAPLPEEFPEFRLCIAKKSLEIFREEQMFSSIQE